MHYEVSKDGFTLQGLVNLQTFEVFQGLHSSPILNYAFDFWLAEKYFEPSWKSGPAKTGPAGPVPSPLPLLPTQLLYIYIPSVILQLL